MALECDKDYFILVAPPVLWLQWLLQVLDVVEEVWRQDLRIGDIPPRADLDIPNLPGEKEGLTEKAMKSAKLAVMKAYKDNEKLASVRPTFLLKLKSARAFRNVSTGL